MFLKSYNSTLLGIMKRLFKRLLPHITITEVYEMNEMVSFARNNTLMNVA